VQNSCISCFRFLDRRAPEDKMERIMSERESKLTSCLLLLLQLGRRRGASGKGNGRANGWDRGRGGVPTVKLGPSSGRSGRGSGRGNQTTTNNSPAASGLAVLAVPSAKKNLQTGQKQTKQRDRQSQRLPPWVGATILDGGGSGNRGGG
jgi:hypothetical protein